MKIYLRVNLRGNNRVVTKKVEDNSEILQGDYITSKKYEDEEQLRLAKFHDEKGLLIL